MRKGRGREEIRRDDRGGERKGGEGRRGRGGGEERRGGEGRGGGEERKWEGRYNCTYNIFQHNPVLTDCSLDLL